MFDYKILLIIVLVIFAIFFIFYGGRGNRNVDHLYLVGGVVNDIYFQNPHPIVNDSPRPLSSLPLSSLPLSSEEKEDEDEDVTERRSGMEFLQGIRFKSNGEELSCRALSEIVQRDVLVNHRGQNIVNPETGRKLELDCFDPITKIAIEYNGIQHYRYPNRFHKTKEDFDSQVRRDGYKIEQCQREGIRLVSVPYTVNSKGPKSEHYTKIYTYIASELSSQ
jgi:hypothetical protein